MKGARSCLERPVSLSSWSINVVAGHPVERLPCFGSQRSSWETVSLERSFKEGESSLWFPFSFFSQCSLSSNLLLLLLILFSRFGLVDRELTINSLFTLKWLRLNCKITVLCSIIFQQSCLHRGDMQAPQSDNQWSCGRRLCSSQSKTSDLSANIWNISTFIQARTNLSSSHRNVAFSRANRPLPILHRRFVGLVFQ